MLMRLDVIVPGGQGPAVRPKRRRTTALASETEGLPKGYPSDTQGNNTGAIPEQYPSNTVAPSCPHRVSQTLS